MYRGERAEVGILDFPEGEFTVALEIVSTDFLQKKLIVTSIPLPDPSKCVCFKGVLTFI